MSNLVQLVESLENKVSRLIKKQDQTSQRVMALETDLKTASNHIKSLQDHIEQLEAKNQTLKTANAMLGSNEYKKETKQRINSLIREIDQCIVQLSE